MLLFRKPAPETVQPDKTVATMSMALVLAKLFKFIFANLISRFPTFEVKPHPLRVAPSFHALWLKVLWQRLLIMARIALSTNPLLQGLVVFFAAE